MDAVFFYFQMKPRDASLLFQCIGRSVGQCTVKLPERLRLLSFTALLSSSTAYGQICDFTEEPSPFSIYLITC